MACMAVASEPVLYFLEGDRKERIVRIENRVFYIERDGELHALTRIGDSGTFALEDLPENLLAKVYVPPRVELLMGPRGRPQDRSNLGVHEQITGDLEWMLSVQKSVEHPGNYLLVNAWYTGDNKLAFRPTMLSATGVDQYRLDTELHPIADNQRGGVPIVFAFNPEEGILDCSGQFGESQALAKALLLDQKDELGRLLESGMNPNRMNNEGWAPMHLAATLFNEAALKLLQAEQGNVNLRDRMGRTPLYYASTRGNLPAAQQLFKRRVRSGLLTEDSESALVPAMRSADLSYIEFLVENGSSMLWSDGRSPGIEAMNHHRDDVVPLLVEKREVPPLNRDTAHIVLAQFIRADRLELVRMQIEHQRMSVQRRLGDDWPVLIAARSASPDMMKLLHEKQAELDVVDSQGRTALHMAAGANATVIPWLIQQGLDPNALTENGWTALGIALVAENINAVLALLEGGADPNIEVGDGHHLLWLATRLAQRQAVSHLVEAGAICEFTPDSALELLEDAFRYDIPAVFDITLAQCIDVDFEFPGGFPSWGVAERYDAHRIQSLMMDRGLKEGSQKELNLVSHREVGRFEPRQIVVPPYPHELALKYGPQDVMVNVVIGRDGKARFPVFLENPVPELKDEIVDYILHWRFNVEGIPESAHGISVTLPLRFRAEEQIFELVELTKMPRGVRQRAPTYPRQLLERRVEGTVIVRFVIDQNGRVLEDRIQIERTAHPDFSKAAIDAVKTWTFEPGEVDGKAVSCWVRQAIPFSIRR